MWYQILIHVILRVKISSNNFIVSQKRDLFFQTNRDEL